jgi:hypothetical protein
VWHLPRNLSDKGGPTSSYPAAGIALKFTGGHKPPHPATESFRHGGGSIEGSEHNRHIKFAVCRNNTCFWAFNSSLDPKKSSISKALPASVIRRKYTISLVHGMNTMSVPESALSNGCNGSGLIHSPDNGSRAGFRNIFFLLTTIRKISSLL